MITRNEILMGRDTLFPLSEELEINLEKLLFALNKFRQKYGKIMIVSSGYRPVSINKNIKNAAKKSNHIVCLACDFVDNDGELGKFCMNHLEILENCGLYLESLDSTKGWIHLQCVPPRSGNRVFGV